MTDSRQKNSDVRKNLPRFGTVAVRLGFITPAQLKEALTEQVDDDLASRPHRPVGSILYDNGLMTAQQLETVLDRIMEDLRLMERDVS
jgi:hypothetical protein